MVVKLPKTDYKGMDRATLEQHKMHIINYKEMYERNIIRDKQQINELKREIRASERMIIDANNELMLIEEEMKHVESVEYETVIIVKKRKVDKYLGKQAPSYYVSSDWKELVVYYFKVCNVNVLGEEKGTQTVFVSGEFVTDRKAAFNDELLVRARQFGVKKIYLDDNVKVNTTVLKRELPGIDIRERA